MNEMRIIWKARDKNGIDMLLSASNEYWLVLKAGDDGMIATNPSLNDMENLQKALTAEILKKKGKK